jgi:predicted nucleotidyltransferase
MTDPRPEDALAHAAAELRSRGKRFALVGGLAISVRGELRATRDVDLAVAVGDDLELETLVADLAQAGYRPVATVEQEARRRFAVVRLESPIGYRVDLLAATLVRERLALITGRGFARNEDLPSKLDALLARRDAST